VTVRVLKMPTSLRIDRHLTQYDAKFRSAPDAGIFIRAARGAQARLNIELAASD
jgi:hypothetical protein